MKLKGNNYQERVQDQLEKWVEGNPIHNDVENECCPDFSCCNSDLLVDEETRQIFKAVSDKGDEDTKMAMLMGFLGDGLAKAMPDTKVKIIGGTDKTMLN